MKHTPERHLGFHEARIVNDFNTLSDLVTHAARDLGATHTSGSDAHTKIYFPRGGQHPYEEATVWRKSGYWHAQGPGARTGVAGLPAGARPIAGHARRAAEPRFKLGAPRPGTSVRDYIAIDSRGRTIAGPSKSYSDMKQAAGGGGTVKFVPSSREASEARRDGTRADPRAVAFFRKHAPGVRGQENEGARALAYAEQEATARGWRVEWRDDPEGWDSLGDIDPETVKEVFYAVLFDENENVLASLGSIVDPDRAYGRVVEAELALEALNNAGIAEARRRPKAKRSARRRRR